MSVISSSALEQQLPSSVSKGTPNRDHGLRNTQEHVLSPSRSSPTHSTLNVSEERLCNVLNHWRLKIAGKYHCIRDAFRALKGATSGDLFISRSDFLKACSTLMGTLTDLNLSKALFDIFDRNRDGVLSWEEFQEMSNSDVNPCLDASRFSEQYVQAPHSDRKNTGRSMDADGGFYALREKNNLKNETIRSQFPGFDRPENDLLSFDDFNDLLHNNGIRMSSEEAGRLFNRLDRSSKGQIRVGELFDALKDSRRGSFADA